MLQQHVGCFVVLLAVHGVVIQALELADVPGPNTAVVAARAELVALGLESDTGDCIGVSDQRLHNFI